jgi:hypothetical protein
MTAILLDLIQPISPISAQTKGQDVYDRFQAEPDTLAIAVVDEEGRPVGLVERNAFFVAMAAHYGRALYALRPISLLMNDAPLVAEGRHAGGRVLRRGAGRPFQRGDEGLRGGQRRPLRRGRLDPGPAAGDQRRQPRSR